MAHLGAIATRLDIHTPRIKVRIMLPAHFRPLPLLNALVCPVSPPNPPRARTAMSPPPRSFVDQAQIISNYQTELYAHQSGLRIAKQSAQLSSSHKKINAPSSASA